MRIILLAMILLAGCTKQSPPAADPAELSDAMTSRSSPAKAFVHDETDELVEFRFSWPPEAAVIPKLASRLAKEMEEARADLRAGAEEDKSLRDTQGTDFHRHMSSTVYETAGQSERLLSLSVENGSYTGGAHGNFGAGALLWDRQMAQEIRFNDLFAATASVEGLLYDQWCAALTAERERKRGGPVGDGGLFEDCPKLDEIAILPVDKDKDGTFDGLTLVASPYVAGPWVEGAYEVGLPVTAKLLQSMKGEYRASFEMSQTQ